MSALPFSVLLVTDERAARQAGRDVVTTVRLALGEDGEGVAVLLRDKERAHDVIAQVARSLAPVVHEAGASLLLHSHADIARAVGARGVHFADGVSLPVGLEALLVGASRHAGAVLEGDAARGLDYVLAAPVFAPGSKPLGAREPLGLEGLAHLCGRSSVPVVALGGVTAANARSCLKAGAAAVAVLGAVMSARDPRAALDALRAAVR